MVPLASVTTTWLPASGVKSAANTVESNPLNVLTRVLDEMSHKWQHSSSPAVNSKEASGENWTTLTPRRDGWTKVHNLVLVCKGQGLNYNKYLWSIMLLGY